MEFVLKETLMILAKISQQKKTNSTSREAAAENSPGRKPGEKSRKMIPSPGGAIDQSDLCRPLRGLIDIVGGGDPRAYARGYFLPRLRRSLRAPTMWPHFTTIAFSRRAVTRPTTSARG